MTFPYNYDICDIPFKVDIPLQVWHPLTSLTSPSKFDNPTKCDIPLQMWQSPTNVTFPYKCDIPLQMWHSPTNVTFPSKLIFPYKFDIPLQVWIAVFDLKNIFSLVSLNEDMLWVLDEFSNTVLCTLWTDTSNLVDISLLHASQKSETQSSLILHWTIKCFMTFQKDE